MKLNTIALFVAFTLINNSLAAQSDFFQIETNKTLCLFSFLEVASHQRNTSTSFQEFIEEHLGKDEAFSELMDQYKNLKIEYNFFKEEYPNNRYAYVNTKDLLWIAASNSRDLEDFSERIIGYLPHQTHIDLIAILKKVEPYYDDLIWSKEQENIQRIEKQLTPYTDRLADLFLDISQFYGTAWDTSIPFKIMLYPIPLESGMTTAIPKANTLICSFLSKDEDTYKGLLGVIVHEMCHILYEQQPIDLQHQIDEWFVNSDLPHNQLAYSYFDEGLATVLGNGWSYEQMNSTLDTMAWYNDMYIDGFAHSLLPLTKTYLEKGKQIDQDYIEQAIRLFGEKFPNSLNEPRLLWNEMQLYANSEAEEDIDAIVAAIRNHFRVRSMWFLTPIKDEKAVESFQKPQTTKVLVVEKDQVATLKLLEQHFPDHAKNLSPNTIEMFRDTVSRSPVFIIHVEDIEKLDQAVRLIKEQEYIEFGKRIRIE